MTRSHPLHPYGPGIGGNLPGAVFDRFGDTVGKVGLHLTLCAMGLGAERELVPRRAVASHQSSVADVLRREAFGLLVELDPVGHRRTLALTGVGADLCHQVNGGRVRWAGVHIGRAVYRLASRGRDPAEWGRKEE